MAEKESTPLEKLQTRLDAFTVGGTAMGNPLYDAMSAAAIQEPEEIEVEQLISLWEGDWLPDRIVSVFAEDVTKHPFELEIPGKEDVRDLIMRRLTDLKYHSFKTEQIKRSLALGDGFIGLGIRQSSGKVALDKPVGLDPEFKNGQLIPPAAVDIANIDYLQVFDQRAISGDPVIEEDVWSPQYGQIKSIKLAAIGEIEERVVHSSRLLHLRPNPSQKTKWGRSIFPAMFLVLKMFYTTTWTVAQVMYQMAFKVIKSDELLGDINTRLAMFESLQKKINALSLFVLGKDEDMYTLSSSAAAGGAQSMLQFAWELVAAVARTPQSHLTGNQLTGRAGAEDTKSYAGRVRAFNENQIRPLDEYTVKLLMLAKEVGNMSLEEVNTSTWTLTYPSFYEPDDTEEAQVDLIKAQIDWGDIREGVITADESRQERRNLEGSAMEQALEGTDQLEQDQEEEIA